jgi:hypothetical protein
MTAQSIRESMQAQAQMMERLSQEMRELFARNASRPQYIPVPTQPSTQPQPPPAFPRYQPPPPQPAPPPSLDEPIVPPPVVSEEGIPRFARDFVGDEEQVEPIELGRAVAAEPGPAEELPIPSIEEDVLRGAAAGAAAEAQSGLAPANAAPTADAVPTANAVPTAAESEPLEQKKDLRQRLRDFLKRIRERLEQRRSKKEGGPAQTAATPGVQAKKPKKAGTKVKQNGAAPVIEPPNSSASLVNYLEELTEYLPEKRKSSFLHSDARLKIEYIKSKLQGRSGIKNQIERRYAPRVEGAAKGKVDGTGGDSNLNAGQIAETFDFMKNLASHHPDKTLGTMLQSKLNAVLHKIRE